MSQPYTDPAAQPQDPSQHTSPAQQPAYQPPYPEQPQYQQAPAPQAAPAYQGQHPGYPQAPQYQGPPAVQQYPGMAGQPPMPNQAYGYPQPKSRVTAGLLGIFLGGLGIHRFYLGFTMIGVIQLVLTLLLGVLTFGLIGLWGVVEGIMIIAGSSAFRADAKGVPLRS